MVVRMPRGGGYGYDYGMELSLDDEAENPDVLTRDRTRAGSTMFDRMKDYGGKAGGMFEGLGESVGPYSNRLMLTGMGLLSGKNAQEGWEGAMKGLVSGSAMDTERGGRKALEGLMNSEGGVFSDLSDAEKEALSKNPDIAAQAFGARLKPRDPIDQYSFTEVDGTLWQTNKYTGESHPVNGGPGGAGGAPFGKPKLTDVMAMRKDLYGMEGNANYNAALPKFESMVSAVYDESSMSDFDFVYGIAQIFDPNSIVQGREGQMVIDAQDIPSALKGRLEKMLNGRAGLGIPARQELVNTARRRVEKYRGMAEREQATYADWARGSGIDPNLIIMPLGDMPELGEPPPVVVGPDDLEGGPAD